MRPPADIHIAQAEARELLVHRICGYIRREDCRQCPATVDTAHGVAHPMCRELALEAVAIVIEDLAERRPGDVTQDNEA